MNLVNKYWKMETMIYKIKALKKLNKYQKDEIINLEAVCKAYDKTRSSVSDGFDEDTKGIRCYFLGYKDNKLVSYMRAYFVENDVEEASDINKAMPKYKVEVVCFVHPFERRKGCFTMMFERAKKELKESGIEIVEFILEPINKDALQVCDRLKAEYNRSEYLMFFDYINNRERKIPSYIEESFKEKEVSLSLKEKVLDKKEALILLEEANLSDIEGILNIYIELFDYSEDEIRQRLKETIMSDSCRLYKAYADKEIVGFINIAEDDDYFCIFDFGVAKMHQKKGYGKAILTELIKELDKLKGSRKSFKIILHVTSRNEAAFYLYKKFGFKIDQQYDYYKLFLT